MNERPEQGGQSPEVGGGTAPADSPWDYPAPSPGREEESRREVRWKGKVVILILL